MQILDRLEQSDTASVAAASRGLRVTSEESLYSHVHLDWMSPPLERVLSLFYAIRNHPDLAAHIQHVSMLSSELRYPAEDPEEEWVPPDIDGDWSQLSSQYQDELNFAKEIITREQFPSPEKWTEALENGDPYAFVAVLLSQLHNLRSLRLDYTFVWQSGFPGLMMRHAMLSTPSDTTLSRFSVLSLVEYGLNVPGSRLWNETLYNYIDAFPVCNPEQFAGWFYLPALKSLEIWLQSFEGVGEELSKRSSKLTHLANLERLVLTESSVEEEDIRNLLSLLSSVKSLNLGLVYPSQDKEKGSRQTSPRPPFSKQGVLFDVIMSVKDTVEHLSISLELCPIFFACFWSEQKFENLEHGMKPFQGFLKKFPRLQTAELPSAMLFGWNHDYAPSLSEVIPSRLQKLCLRGNLTCVYGYDWDLELVAAVVRNFLPEAQSKTPLLNTITLRIFEIGGDSDFWQSYAVPVQSAAKQLELEMDITLISDSLSPGRWTTSRELKEYVPE